MLSLMTTTTPRTFNGSKFIDYTGTAEEIATLRATLIAKRGYSIGMIDGAEGIVVNAFGRITHHNLRTI